MADENSVFLFQNLLNKFKIVIYIYPMGLTFEKCPILIFWGHFSESFVNKMSYNWVFHIYKNLSLSYIMVSEVTCDKINLCIMLSVLKYGCKLQYYYYCLKQ